MTAVGRARSIGLDLEGAIALLTTTPFDHTRITLVRVTLIAWLAEIEEALAATDFDTALALTTSQIKLLEEAGATFGLVMLYRYLGEAFFWQGTLAAGIEAFRWGTAVATETGAVHCLRSILAKPSLQKKPAPPSNRSSRIFQKGATGFVPGVARS